ncbi:hypothetical protein CK203_042592 [Vitis vinifera]|uniref:Uncharacterized protein n=1 Tax=Vitis vinifera TaxID=29760 RepID=A0A438I805_VITVI|nr:hypothetical protein CK203_042592 [Vitis vinifera]
MGPEAGTPFCLKPVYYFNHHYLIKGMLPYSMPRFSRILAFAWKYVLQKWESTLSTGNWYVKWFRMHRKGIYPRLFFFSLSLLIFIDFKNVFFQIYISII